MSVAAGRCAAVLFGALAAAHIAVAAGAEPKGVPRSQRHGYKSSKPWLPRTPVITGPTGQELVADNELPKFFDWRDVNGVSYVTPDLNQHIPQYCGACWIHGSVHTLNDRIKVAHGAKYPDVQLARQALMNCVPNPEVEGPPPGCMGGDAWMIHKYMHEVGVPDDTCMPYTAENMGCKPENVCRNCNSTGILQPDGSTLYVPGACYPVEHYNTYKVRDYGNLTGELAMMKEIYARGPIACSLATDDPFEYAYSQNPGVIKENVYTVDTEYKETDIDHLMEFTGWGETESGTKYWIVRNSWGTYWGDMGWVYFRRGVNQQLMESAGCDWAVVSMEGLEQELKYPPRGDYIYGMHRTGPKRAGQALGSQGPTRADTWVTLTLTQIVVFGTTLMLVSATGGAALAKRFSRRPSIVPPSSALG